MNHKTVFKILQGDLLADYMGTMASFGFGAKTSSMSSFPHFSKVEFDGKFPVATLTFCDDAFPGIVKLKATNPFIPLDSKNSSLPCAFFDVEIINNTCEDVRYTITMVVENPAEVSVNKSVCETDMRYVKLENRASDFEKSETDGLAVLVSGKNTFSQTYWYRGGWQDGISMFFNELSGGTIKERNYATAGKKDKCVIGREIYSKPGDASHTELILTWYYPIFRKYWDDDPTVCWRNYYATIFESAEDVALYCYKNRKDLVERTDCFCDALHSITLPQEVMDATSSTMSVLKSATVLRLEDGTFYGWEGIAMDHGSCEGTCQHVWNYAYALCFLFPDLERSIRDAELRYSFDEAGHTCFRLQTPLGRKKSDARACVDGQMGIVIKCFREWKISGDNEWLASHWEKLIGGSCKQSADRGHHCAV